MYNLIRNLLFNLDAEKAHYLAMDMLTWANAFGLSSLVGGFPEQYPNLKKEVAGLIFKNPIGLAAGFDKNALWISELSKLNFSHIEIGTVTPLAQEGNPKPRLFRLINDQGIINRMGFNNDGADVISKRLDKLKKPHDLIIGGNIGKNKITPNEYAYNDYLICFQKLRDYVDYFVINVSSPNTPNLRELQEKDSLEKIIDVLQNENIKSSKKPIFLKIAPDLNESQINVILEIINIGSLSGIIATNTTISRDGLIESKEKVEKIGMGGLSGSPLTNRAMEVLKFLRLNSPINYPIISSGGIMTPLEAKERLKMGADLIQIYTGFIYGGPSIVNEMLKMISLK